MKAKRVTAKGAATPRAKAKPSAKTAPKAKASPKKPAAPPKKATAKAAAPSKPKPAPKAAAKAPAKPAKPAAPPTKPVAKPSPAKGAAPASVAGSTPARSTTAKSTTARSTTARSTTAKATPGKAAPGKASAPGKSAAAAKPAPSKASAPGKSAGAAKPVPATQSATAAKSASAAKPAAAAKPGVAKPGVAKPGVAKPGVAANSGAAAKPSAAKPGAVKPGTKPAAPAVAKGAPPAKGKVVARKPTIVAPPPPRVPPEEVLLEKVQRAIQAGEVENAERLLEQMIGEFPEDPRGRIYLGNLRKRRGDEKGALEEYTKILRKSPQEPLALWYKAELHLAQKPDPDFAQAVAAYKKIVEAHGRKKDERSTKFVAEAKKQLRFCEARKLSLQSRRFLTSREARTLKKGRELLEKALKIYPEDARNHMNLGVAFLLLGDADKAITLCEEAIKINPRYARAHLMLGRALRKLQRLRHARDAFLKCIELDRSGRDAQDAWNDRREVERDLQKVRLTLFQALSGRQAPDGQRVRLTLGEMKSMITMLEGDEIKEADLTANAQKNFTLTAYSQRHRYRIYPGPESLVIEPDAQTG